MFTEVVNLLRAKGAGDVLVVGGGIIPEEDIQALKAAGVAEIFGPGTPLANVVNYIKDKIK